MKKWDKRGTDKILSVYWFAILFIVASGVVYMATLYYGEPYDIREIEANFMINHVADCLSKGGKLVGGWKEMNIEDKCNLNFNSEDVYGWNNDQYYLEVIINEFNGNPIGDAIIAGNSNLESFCKQKGKRLPVCVDRSFYSIEGDIQYEIKIKSVVNKVDKNVM